MSSRNKKWNDLKLDPLAKDSKRYHSVDKMIQQEIHNQQAGNKDAQKVDEKIDEKSSSKIDSSVGNSPQQNSPQNSPQHSPQNSPQIEKRGESPIDQKKATIPLGLHSVPNI